MKKRICILEDSNEILEILTIVMESESYEVFGFGTVSGFLSGYESIGPAICLLDVMLPDGNGLDVCNAVKSNPSTSSVPVIIMTANARMDRMAETCKADDFIAKPFDIDDLSGRVNLLAKTL